MSGRLPTDGLKRVLRTADDRRSAAGGTPARCIGVLNGIPRIDHELDFAVEEVKQGHELAETLEEEGE
jgi:hypothetical protein